MKHLIYQEVKQRKWMFLIAFALFVLFYYAYGQKNREHGRFVYALSFNNRLHHFWCGGGN